MRIKNMQPCELGQSALNEEEEESEPSHSCLLPMFLSQPLLLWLLQNSFNASVPERNQRRIIYEQEGVFIHSSCGKINDQDSLISGVLRVLEKDADVIVDWRPLDDTLDSSSILCAGKDSSSVVEWTQTPKERILRGSEHQTSYEAEWDMVNTVSFKKKSHTNGVIHKKTFIVHVSSSEYHTDLAIYYKVQCI
uniref:TBC1 domain family member 15 n=1 Tax=Sarcophilus harrisii TaxID=9305 RepID=A0A7N4PRL0_SARHA